MKKSISFIAFVLMLTVVVFMTIPVHAEQVQSTEALFSDIVGHIRNLETEFTVDYISDHPMEQWEWDAMELRVLRCAYGSDIESYGMSYVPQDDAHYTVEFSASYRVTAKQTAAVNAKIQEIIRSLQLDGKSPYEKAFSLYNYIATTCSYDYDVGPMCQTAYSALIDHYSVCEGFSSAYTRLLEAVGIESHVVTGVISDIAHAWNAVNIEGTYYYCDITSDLNQLTYSHFMRGQEDFYNHTPDGLTPYPIIASAGQDVEAELYAWNGFRYCKGKDGIVIMQYEGDTETLTIPAQIDGIPVYRVNRYAIQNQNIRSLILEEGIQMLEAGFMERCDVLESITLPSTVQLVALTGDVFATFAESLVESCQNLAEINLAADNPYLCLVDGILYDAAKTRIVQVPACLNREVVTIPEGVTQISSSAFEYNPYIKKVVLPSTVTYIGYWAFSNCTNLEEINIPDGCKTICQYFIQDTQVSRLEIPASVDLIMPCALAGTHLEQLIIDENNPKYKVCNNTMYEESENSVALFYYMPNAQAKTMHIKPETSIIYAHAFAGNPYLEEVILNEGLQVIETRAFENCTSLKNVVFPEGITRIEESAFSYTALSGEIVLPASLQSFGQSWQVLPGSVFDGTNVTAITVREPNAYFTSSDGCLYNDDLTTLYYVPAFGRKTYTISDSVKRIASWAIQEIEYLTVPESVERFDDGAIYCPHIIGVRGSSAETYVNEMGDWFHFHPIPLPERTMVLPEGLNAIQEEAFAGNSSFEAVVLPESCTRIEAGAFRDCKGLMQITIPASIISIDDDAFADCSDNLLIICPEEMEAEAFARGHNLTPMPLTK